jgi:hypothetical protein
MLRGARNRVLMSLLGSEVTRHVSALDLERVLHQLARDSVSLAPDTDHVEARIAVVQAVLAQEISGGPHHPHLFAAIDGFEWASESLLGARLHFDEDDRETVERDQVYLSGGAPVVLLQDLVTMPAQKLCRRPFPLGAQNLALIRHGGRIRKTGGDWQTAASARRSGRACPVS